MLSPGDILQSRYRIERPLGRGGMASVYLAHHLELDRPVAVKVLRVDPQAWPGALSQFRIEARILHELRHPNLPLVFDLLEEGGLYCLVMEYVPGRTLDDVLMAEGPLDEARVLHWARQMGDALHYLHTRRVPVIYRDMKPSNVMLTPGERIKLVDFGIAKFQDTAAGPVTRTAARGALSPGFAAPEQYAGGTDPCSDVYSLGATLYRLLTRELPPESVDLATGRAGLIPLREVRPDVSESTALAVEAMMTLDRTFRLPNAAAALRALGFTPDETAEMPDEEPGDSASTPLPEPAGRAEAPGASALPPERPTRAHEPPPERASQPEAPGRFALPPETPTRLHAPPPRPAPARRSRPPARPAPRTWAMLLSLLLALVVALAAWLLRPGTPVVADRASLAIQSVPTGAEVQVDGQVWGRAPLRLEAVAPGTHEVVLTRPGYQEARERVSVAAGERTTVALTLTAAPAILVLQAAPPGAEVQLDGRAAGRTGSTPLRLELEGGAHSLRVYRKGWQEERREVRLGPGETRSLALDLRPEAAPRPGRAPRAPPDLPRAPPQPAPR